MNFLQLLEEQLRQQRPAFQPTAVEGLLQQPQQDSVQAYSPETFVPEGLLNRHTARNVARGAGLLGLGFAPGAGVGDYAGQFPSFQGGLEPGFAENVEQGNYGTAALQSLGAFGDLAMTVPVLGAVVGSAAKAPRAIQRATRMRGAPEQPSVMPQVDDLGFYSQVEKSLLDIPQQKGTGEQFLAQLQKSPGVRPEELQYTGVDQFLASRPSVTKAEVQDYLDANRVQVQEVVLSGNRKPVSKMTDNELRDYYRQTMDVSVRDEYGPNWRESRREIELELTNPELEISVPVGTTRYAEQTLPGGENYREVLLTLPRAETNPSFARMAEIEQAVRDPNISTRKLNELRREYADLADTTRFAGEQENIYRSAHFDQPNILAHMRVNDRTVDGKRTMFIEEVQSDWHQTGRREGYAQQIRPEQLSAKEVLPQPPGPRVWEVTYPDGTTLNFAGNSAEDAISSAVTRESGRGVPDAPFKSTWDELTLKRAIKMASDDGYEQIGFTTGKIQADRYPGDARRAAGMETFYDKMLPKKLEKIGKKYGAKPTKSTMQTPDGEVEVWTFDIPADMRDVVREQGLPLFQIGAGAAGVGAAGLLGTEDEQF